MKPPGRDFCQALPSSSGLSFGYIFVFYHNPVESALNPSWRTPRGFPRMRRRRRLPDFSWKLAGKKWGRVPSKFDFWLFPLFSYGIIFFLAAPAQKQTSKKQRLSDSSPPFAAERFLFFTGNAAEFWNFGGVERGIPAPSCVS